VLKTFYTFIRFSFAALRLGERIFFFFHSIARNYKYFFVFKSIKKAG